MRLFRNFPYKVLSVICALAFWFFLVIFQNVIYDLEEALILDIQNKPDGFEIASELPEIHVRVTAPKDEISFIRPEDFTAYIDLQEDIDEQSIAHVHVTTTRSNVNIVSFTPDIFPIALESVKSKLFPAKGAIVGQPATGYTSKTLSYRLGQVKVTGPQSSVDDIAYVQFEVPLEGIETESIIGSYKLYAYDIMGSRIETGLAFKPQVADATVEVEKLVLKRTVPIRLRFAEDVDPVRVGQSIIDPSTVVVTGEETVLSQVEFIETEIIDRILIDNILRKRVDSVRLNIPEGLEVMDEQTIKVTIQ
jgi:YbbR domain-containing protein